ncbi:hypothetical protein AWZ03_012081 [Drosophila navojoa]|uniref:Uncharacterized protein n=1 Tax=Drosophila navojoa TaxID=7232 RepID=A0A484AYP9_DRONA|nr:hypothetical protein AWZ03_012081 [Drosophila navojoa]
MAEISLTDSDSTWDMLEEKTVKKLSDNPRKFGKHLRREVAQLFRTPSFVREIADELRLLTPQVESSSNDKYVKIDDLKETVANLISRNVVGQSLAMLQDSNKHFGTMIDQITEHLVQLNERVNQVTYDLQEIAQEKKSPHSSPTRLTAGAASTTHHSCESQSYIAKPEKLRMYNDLICKYNKQLKDWSSNDMSNSSTASKSEAPASQTNEKEKSVRLWCVPQFSAPNSKRPDRDTDSKQKLRCKYDRRAAERRQFDANMLMYRKSQFSLKLNSRNENFPYKLWNRGYTSEHLNIPPAFQ